MGRVKQNETRVDSHAERASEKLPLARVLSRGLAPSALSTVAHAGGALSVSMTTGVIDSVTFDTL